MIRFNNVLVMWAAFALVACAGAEEKGRSAQVPIGQIFSRLEARPDSFQTVTFSFTQSATVQGRTIDSEGECSLAEGGKVHMLTRMPTQIGEVTSLLVSDGQVMWHEVRANSALQVIRYDLSRIDASTEANLTGLGIWGTLERERFADLRAHMNTLYDFRVAAVDGSSESTVITVEGHNRNGDGSLLVSLGTDDYFLRSLTTLDQNGRKTHQMTIGDLQLDAPISLSNFLYSPPAGAKVEDGNAMLKSLTGRPRRHQMEQSEAPDFTLTSLDGNSVNLRSLRGKTVILDFWAIWCGPCLQQMPHVQRIHESFADDGVIVLGINTDTPGAVNKARRYIEKKGYSFTNLIDDRNEAAALYQIRGLPTTVIISRDGIVDHYLFGAHSEQAIRAALGESGVLSN